MRNVDQLIELAARHVDTGRVIVERQRNLVALRPNLQGAIELLRSFERSQAIFEDDLARNIKERDGQRNQSSL